MATAQAAAAAACISLLDGVPVSKVDLAKVREFLLRYDAILP
jgi:hypothetical protein